MGRDAGAGRPLRRDYDEDDAYPSPYSIVAHQIGAAMRGAADYLVDLHCAWTLSVPFSIRDRVFYRDDRERPQPGLVGGRDRQEWGPESRVEVEPDEVVLPPAGRHRFLVTAHFSNGQQEDISSQVLYVSGNPEVVKVVLA